MQVNILFFYWEKNLAGKKLKYESSIPEHVTYTHFMPNYHFKKVLSSQLQRSKNERKVFIQHIRCD